MEHINAPYNFVPLSDKVVTPEWADQVSQDLPFRDGISGELGLTITALSPIMVGGDQKQATRNESGQVYFFKTPSMPGYPEGRYAIPGSSLRGAIRSVFEIATFSRMSRIDDKRYGLRDITGPRVSESYTSRVRDNVRYGFLSLDRGGEARIQPCSMVRLDHRFIEKVWKCDSPVFPKQKTVQEKYSIWEKLCKDKAIEDPLNIYIKLNGNEISHLGSQVDGVVEGYPVFTGQISDKSNDKKDKNGNMIYGKYKDFIFHSPEPESFVVSEVDSKAWGNFLFIHGDEEKKQNMSWPGFWRSKFRNGERVPIFYVQTTDRLHIGLAYMPKLAGDFSTHDMLKHTHEDHLDLTKPDMTSLVFGLVGDKPADSFKGRISIEPAFLQTTPEINKSPKETILNGAKPSYFPNYLYQKSDGSGKLSGKQYATYVFSQSNPAPELRGWKRYPVRGHEEVEVQPLGKNQTKAVQTRLFNLKEGATFTARLAFHNLKPVELGALLWTLKFEQSRHSLGMGKSFGYGQIQIALNWEESQVQCNDFNSSVSSDYESYISSFQDYMTENIEVTWGESVPITSLLAMSDLSSRGKFKGELKHMVLDSKDFTNAKQKGLVLGGYVEDKRSLKRFSHVSVGIKKEGQQSAELVRKTQIWSSMAVHFQPGSNVLTATGKKGKAILAGTDAKLIFDQLSKSAQKKAKSNKLVRTVEVMSTNGNEHIITGFLD